MTLVSSGSAADDSCMVLTADLLDDARLRLSPELVLVDSALSAEVRHLLEVPEDTLERLQRDGDRRRASQEVASPPAPDHFGLTQYEHTQFSEDEFAPQESVKHSTASDTEPLQPAPELDDLIRRQDVASAGQVVEYVTPDESPQGPSNTYPVLPAPPPEYSQEDATDTVLRMITRTA